MEWKDYPGLPGVKFVVLAGDPSQAGLYVIRAKFAPHTMSRPHSHPEARYVTVLKGTWWAGTGQDFDPNSTTPIPAGGFAIHTPGKVHYDGAKDEEVIVQISGIGGIMSQDRVLATYLIETPHALEHAAAVIAGEQSSGTFVSVPGGDATN